MLLKTLCAVFVTCLYTGVQAAASNNGFYAEDSQDDQYVPAGGNASNPNPNNNFYGTGFYGNAQPQYTPSSYAYPSGVGPASSSQYRSPYLQRAAPSHASTKQGLQHPLLFRPIAPAVYNTAQHILRALEFGADNMLEGVRARQSARNQIYQQLNAMGPYQVDPETEKRFLQQLDAQPLRFGGKLDGHAIAELLLSLAEAIERSFIRAINWMNDFGNAAVANNGVQPAAGYYPGANGLAGLPYQQAKLRAAFSSYAAGGDRSVVFDPISREERVPSARIVSFYMEVQSVMGAVEQEALANFKGHAALDRLLASFGVTVSDLERTALLRSSISLVTQYEFEQCQRRIDETLATAAQNGGFIPVSSVRPLMPAYEQLTGFVVSLTAEGSYRGKAMQEFGRVLLENFDEIKAIVRASGNSVITTVTGLFGIVAQNASGASRNKLGAVFNDILSAAAGHTGSATRRSYHIPALIKAIGDIVKKGPLDVQSAAATLQAISSLTISLQRLKRSFVAADSSSVVLNPWSGTVPLTLSDFGKSEERKRAVRRELVRVFSSMPFSQNHREAAARVFLKTRNGRFLMRALSSLLVDPEFGDDVILFLQSFVRAAPLNTASLNTYIQGSTVALSVLRELYEESRGRRTPAPANPNRRTSFDDEYDSDVRAARRLGIKAATRGQPLPQGAILPRASRSSGLGQPAQVSQAELDPLTLLRWIFTRLPAVWNFFGRESYADDAQRAVVFLARAWRKEVAVLPISPSKQRMTEFVRVLRFNLQNPAFLQELNDFLMKPIGERHTRDFCALARHLVPRTDAGIVLNNNAINKMASEIFAIIRGVRSDVLIQQFRAVLAAFTDILNAPELHAYQKGQMLYKLGYAKADILLELSMAPGFPEAVMFFKKWLLVELIRDSRARRIVGF